MPASLCSMQMGLEPGLAKAVTMLQVMHGPLMSQAHLEDAKLHWAGALRLLTELHKSVLDS